MRHLIILFMLFISSPVIAFTGCSKTKPSALNFTDIERLNSNGNSVGLFQYLGMKSVIKDNNLNEDYLVQVNLKNFITGERIKVLFKGTGSSEAAYLEGRKYFHTQIQENIINSEKRVFALHLQKISELYVNNKQVIKIAAKNNIKYIVADNSIPCTNQMDYEETKQNILHYFQIEKKKQLEQILKQSKH